METRVIKADPDTREGLELLREAGDVIKAGGLVAVPTETVYGLAGNALDPGSARKIYEAKGRPSDNPLIVHIAKMDDLKVIVQDIPDKALRLADAFWPGPLTMVFHKNPVVPDETTGGLDTVAVRFPTGRIMQLLTEFSGGFIAAPSANRSGRPSCTRAEHCIEDLSGRIDMIIDGGEAGIGLESTVIDMTCDPPVLLRQGYINKSMLESVTGPVKTETGPQEHPRSPGMKYRHYAPKGRLTIVRGEKDSVCRRICELASDSSRLGKKTAILAPSEHLSCYGDHPGIRLIDAGSMDDEDGIAHRLFAILRELDEEDTEEIYCECFDTPRLGSAIMDRLTRASGNRILNV